MPSIDQQFLEFIVKSLVGHPEAVKIERRIDEKGVLLELTVDPEDLGRVIGKRGSTAQSIRSLLRALGTKNDARYNLKIIDNGYPRSNDNYRSTETEAVPAKEVKTDDKKEATLAVKTDDTPVEIDLEEEEEAPVKATTGDVVSNTRKELEELDDLEV